MIIERKINGQMLSFELTDKEICEAYSEQEHKYDRQDVERALEAYLYEGGDEDFYEEYKVPFKKVYQNDEMIDMLAAEKRRNQDKYEMSWTAARDEAFKDVLYDYQEDEEQALGDCIANATQSSESVKNSAKEMYIRLISAEICEKLEELLDEYDLTIPSENREGTAGEARIYGEVYSDLESNVTDVLATLCGMVKENLDILINADEIDELKPVTEAGVVYVRAFAMKVCELFEELLDGHDISIPSDDREGEEEEARIYGDVYYEMEDAVTKVLVGLCEEIKVSPDVVINIEDYNGFVNEDVSNMKHLIKTAMEDMFQRNCICDYKFLQNGREVYQKNMYAFDAYMMACDMSTKGNVECYMAPNNTKAYKPVFTVIDGVITLSGQIIKNRENTLEDKLADASRRSKEIFTGKPIIVDKTTNIERAIEKE